MSVCLRDLRFVRRQAIVQGTLRPPEVDLAEVVEALREEVMSLREQLAEATDRVLTPQN
jgi:hypothetical protein